jgi:hypothetical protein
MSLFSRLAQISSNINDAVIGERLRVTPRTEARYSAAPPADTSRATLDEVTGIYKEVVARVRTADAAAGRDFERRFMAPTITISIRRDLLGADAYRRGDIITRLDEPGEPEFEISAADPIDDGRIAFTVTLVSK